ncbi:MAG: ABC transporter permease [Gemmatimonadales bacterium]|nr:ABC transporter permease [Gemmatimonadota bacterium]MDX2057934.1 ABC transporter permease [Gemmatimonadales bacterium]
MPFSEAIRLAIESIRSSKLRSFFTLLGIIVSVGFLVTVVAIIQGLNSYVADNLTGAMIGTNAFQVRRAPIAMQLLSDEEVRRIRMRPVVSQEDAEVVRAALPDAQAVALQSGWPTPSVDVTNRNRELSGVMTFGVTPEYQIVQDYQFAAGEPMADPDVRERRYVAVVGYDIAKELFDGPEQAIGKVIRVAGLPLTIKGVIEAKGRMLGQSFDAFILTPISTFESMFGRRLTTTISVKMRTAAEIPSGMARAEEAMRLAHRLRPREENDFTVDKADALVAFWTTLTSVLFLVVPAVVAIGIVVGGIVIMNVMLMSVNERTYEIGLRKSLGARQRDIRRQFLVEAVILALLGGAFGVLSGATLAGLISLVSPLPAKVTAWSVGVSLALGAGTGILFGVYPASRAARLDPIAALRAEV